MIFFKDQIDGHQSVELRNVVCIIFQKFSQSHLPSLLKIQLDELGNEFHSQRRFGFRQEIDD